MFDFNFSTVLGTVMVLITVDANARSSIRFNPSFRVTLLNLEFPVKALSPIYSMLLGISTVLSPLHSNVELPLGN